MFFCTHIISKNDIKFSRKNYFRKFALDENFIQFTKA